VVGADPPFRQEPVSLQSEILRRCRARLAWLAILCIAAFSANTRGGPPQASCQGTVHDAQGNAQAGARIELRSGADGKTLHSSTDQSGAFGFADLPAGAYSVSVVLRQRVASADKPLVIPEGHNLKIDLTVTSDGRLILDGVGAVGARAADAGQNSTEAATPQSSGGQQLSSKQVSSLPLNKRDFSQLLLLASGTQSDTNGSSNFTQQFAVNGQRGTTAVFAMDGIFLSDPEMSGATFSNYNVEAIQEIRSNSGVMPAVIGEGAASFTDIITKQGASQIHGGVFSFVRNAAFDARNFFDRKSQAQPGRIPPFVRNEFGFTNGGPIVLPGLYDGRGRTFYLANTRVSGRYWERRRNFPCPRWQSGRV